MKLDFYNLQRTERTQASNGNLRIIGILHDTDEYVLLERPHRYYKLYYSDRGAYTGYYFIKGRVKYYLNDFFKEGF